jgi:hypothetical protein
VRSCPLRIKKSYVDSVWRVTFSGEFVRNILTGVLCSSGFLFTVQLIIFENDCLWVVASYNLVDVYLLFRGHPHDRRSKHLWNVIKLLTYYTVLQIRRQPSSYWPPWELEILPVNLFLPDLNLMYHTGNGGLFLRIILNFCCRYGHFYMPTILQPGAQRGLSWVGSPGGYQRGACSHSNTVRTYSRYLPYPFVLESKRMFLFGVTS